VDGRSDGDAPDRTLEERLACEVIDGPVDPLRSQASPLFERVMVAGGACDWPSDILRVADGCDVYASSCEMAAPHE
jgi:hypothetical protein